MLRIDQRCAELCRPGHAYRYPLTTQGRAPSGTHLARVDDGPVPRAAAQVAVQARLEVISCWRHISLLGLPQHAVHRDGEARRAVPALRRVEASQALCERHTELGCEAAEHRLHRHWAAALAAGGLPTMLDARAAAAGVNLPALGMTTHGLMIPACGLDTDTSTCNTPCTGWKPEAELPMPSAVVMAAPLRPPIGARHALMLRVCTLPGSCKQNRLRYCYFSTLPDAPVRKGFRTCLWPGPCGPLRLRTPHSRPVRKRS